MPGDEVVVRPLDWCGTCPACTRGFTHICQRLNFIGIDSPGALQEYWNVPARTLLSVPKGLGLRNAALTEPTAVALHDVRRSGLRVEEKVLVVGGGPIGMFMAVSGHRGGSRRRRQRAQRPTSSTHGAGRATQR